MEAELKQALFAVAEVFAAARKLKLSTVAAYCIDDARFFERLAAGKGFEVGTYDRVMGWFSANWPEGAPWPDAVPRPVSATVAAEAVS